ncbi:MAG: prepilin-type N-terminal cleavage/methylation domain-containing protein [Candidatus Sungbacteria bacterium]|nr:prepilin-type N-terminal cleavage/methylation domain-containing protein [Candidatus Sungbacteria bacterium]
MMGVSKKLNEGFTLLEVLISISVLALISGMALVSFVNSRNVREAIVSGQDMISVLRLAQSKSIGGEDNSAWGVHLEQGQAVLFRGTSYAGATFTQNFSIPARLEIADIALTGGGSDVIFKRITGRTDQAGSFAVRVRTAASISFSVSIDNSGKIYQTGAAQTPAGTRIVDTRHRSFSLGWSLQGYTNMILTFSDPPNPDIVQTIPMAPYFSGGQTKFDWSGNFYIGGQNQVLRIHTTALDGANTILSIDRDCRYNTKKLKIAFDTRDVATYEANCTTVTVGAYGGTMSEP